MTDWSRRVLVVEDESLTATLLKKLLSGAGFEVETAASALAARKLVESFDPDVALIDIQLGEGPSGLDLAHILHSQHPDLALLFLTKQQYIDQAGEGANLIPPNAGFLRKDLVTDADYLFEAIEAVLSDRPKDARKGLEESHELTHLTKKQLEVLRLMALGLSNAAIASERETGEAAVEVVVTNIYRALDLKADVTLNPRVEAVRKYIDAFGIPRR